MMGRKEEAMCGLYSLRRSEEEVRATFGYDGEAVLAPRDYVTPGGPMAIVRLERGSRRLAWVRWGLVPSWTREVKPGKPLINARGESVLDKPSFRNAMRRRRCLVPADGFYEWKGEVPGRKQPYHIHRPDGQVFAFAGLWEHWMGADGSEIESAAIITTAANRSIASIHDRMPVVIAPEHHAQWLDADNVPAAEAARLLVAAPEDFFLAEPTVIRRSAPPRPAAPPAPASDEQLKLV
jgi:putative SOS response-associated peptidase YedK